MSSNLTDRLLTATCDLVIFDLDGTVFDSHEVMSRAFQAAYFRAVPNAAKAPVEELRSRQGIPFPEICMEMGWPSELTQYFIEESQILAHEVQVFPQALELIKFLLDSAVPLAVLTGKDRLRSTELLRRFGLDTDFSLAVCGDDPFRGKPYPDGLTHLIQATGSRVSATYYIGDALNDQLCADSAGVQFIGVEWPSQPHLLPQGDGRSIFRDSSSIIERFWKA